MDERRNHPAVVFTSNRSDDQDKVLNLTLRFVAWSEIQIQSIVPAWCEQPIPLPLCWIPTNHCWDLRSCRLIVSMDPDDHTRCFCACVPPPLSSLILRSTLQISHSFAMLPFQGSLCGFMCCCIFYSIRIFGKLWPQQQVNDVGNFSFLIIFPLFCLDLWEAFSLHMAVLWMFQCGFFFILFTCILQSCLYAWIINSTAINAGFISYSILL